MSIRGLRTRRQSPDAEKKRKSFSRPQTIQTMGSSTVNHCSRSRNVKVGQLTRPSSEPVLCKEETSDDAFDDSSNISSLQRFPTYIDLPSSSHVTKPPFPRCLSEGERKRGVYTEDSKVLVKVTVQKSPGPVKALVKLGTTIEEAISTVIDEYRKERRRPALDEDDTASLFQLYDSYFSNQGKSNDFFHDVQAWRCRLPKLPPSKGRTRCNQHSYGK